jgi:CheY-like chemotaxis protein
MRFAMIETSDADARWLQVVLTDLRADVRVERFVTEVEALARLPELHASFDAILLDERPAVLTLRETLEELASIPGVARVPVVVMLGSAANLAHVPRGRVLGCIRKPMDAGQLRGLIQLLSGERRSTLGSS